MDMMKGFCNKAKNAIIQVIESTIYSTIVGLQPQLASAFGVALVYVYAYFQETGTWLYGILLSVLPYPFVACCLILLVQQLIPWILTLDMCSSITFWGSDNIPWSHRYDSRAIQSSIRNSIDSDMGDQKSKFQCRCCQVDMIQSPYYELRAVYDTEDSDEYSGCTKVFLLQFWACNICNTVNIKNLSNSEEYNFTCDEREGYEDYGAVSEYCDEVNRYEPGSFFTKEQNPFPLPNITAYHAKQPVFITPINHTIITTCRCQDGEVFKSKLLMKLTQTYQHKFLVRWFKNCMLFVTETVQILRCEFAECRRIKIRYNWTYKFFAPK